MVGPGLSPDVGRAWSVISFLDLSRRAARAASERCPEAPDRNLGRLSRSRPTTGSRTSRSPDRMVVQVGRRDRRAVGRDQRQRRQVAHLDRLEIGEFCASPDPARAGHRRGSCPPPGSSSRAVGEGHALLDVGGDVEAVHADRRIGPRGADDDAHVEVAVGVDALDEAGHVSGAIVRSIPIWRNCSRMYSEILSGSSPHGSGSMMMAKRLPLASRL